MARVWRSLLPLLLVPFAALAFLKSHLHFTTASTATLQSAPPSPFVCDIPPRSDILQDPPASLPTSVRQYVQWHRRMRRCLQSGTCSRTPRLLVWRCKSSRPCSGVGDRLRGINFIFLLAVATRRLLLIDWDSGRYSRFALRVALRPNVLDWTLPPKFVYPSSALDLNWQNMDVGALPPPSNLPPSDPSIPFASASAPLPSYLVSTHPRHRVISVLSNMPLGSFNAFRRNPHLPPSVRDLNFTNMPTLTLLRLIMTVLYQPTHAVLSRASLFAFSPTQSFVGVHARTGDDVLEAHHPRFSLMKNRTLVSTLLMRCVDQLLKRRDLSDVSPRLVYLASDSAALKQTFRAVAAANFTTSVNFAPSRAVHVAQRVSPSEDDSPAVEECARFLDVFVDLWMLAQSRAVVMTGSGFARAGYSWGNASQLRLALSDEGRYKCSPYLVGR